MGAQIESGIDLVLSLTGWTEAASSADLVVTGEGTVDLSSTEGKVVSGVVAAAAGLPVVVFGGRVQPEGAAALRRLGAADVVPLSGKITTAADDLRYLGEQLARQLPASNRVRS